MDALLAGFKSGTAQALEASQEATPPEPSPDAIDLDYDGSTPGDAAPDGLEGGGDPAPQHQPDATDHPEAGTTSKDSPASDAEQAPSLGTGAAPTQRSEPQRSASSARHSFKRKVADVVRFATLPALRSGALVDKDAYKVTVRKIVHGIVEHEKQRKLGAKERRWHFSRSVTSPRIRKFVAKYLAKKTGKEVKTMLAPPARAPQPAPAASAEVLIGSPGGPSTSPAPLAPLQPARHSSPTHAPRRGPAAVATGAAASIWQRPAGFNPYAAGSSIPPPPSQPPSHSALRGQAAVHHSADARGAREQVRHIGGAAKRGASRSPRRDRPIKRAA